MTKPSERAEAKAYRHCLADRDTAKAAYETAKRGSEDLRGPLTSTEESELAWWRAELRLDDATEDLNVTDPSLVKLRRFLDAAASAFVAANAPQPALVLGSIDDLEAHATAIAERDARDTFRKAAAARVVVAWQAGHDALALVAAERKSTALPPPIVRGFGMAPLTLEAAGEWLNPNPYVSSARWQINRLERLRAEREDRTEFEVVRVLRGQGVAPGARERVPRASGSSVR